MITIHDSADMERVLTGPFDLSLKTILQDRLELLAEYLNDWDLADLAHFIMVEPGDSIEAIEKELGISPFENLVDGARYPAPAFEPSWEHCIVREGYIEAGFALCDAGLGLVLLVPDRDGVVPELRAMLKAYATTNPKPTD